MALHSHQSINQILMTEQKMGDLKQLMWQFSFQGNSSWSISPDMQWNKLVFSPLYLTVLVWLLTAGFKEIKEVSLLE